MKEIINVKSVEVNNSTITIIDDSDQIYRYSSLEIKHVQLLSDKKSSALKFTKYQEELFNVVFFVFLIIIYRFLFRISPKNDIGIILKIVYYSILPLLISFIPAYLVTLSLGMSKKNRDIFSISTDLKTYQKFRDSNSRILFSGFFDKNIDWDKEEEKEIFINYTNNRWGWGVFSFLILVSYLIYEASANNYLQDHPYWHISNNNSNWLNEFYLSFIIVIKTIAFIINKILFGIWKIIAHCLPEISIFLILVRLVDLMTIYSPIMTKLTYFLYEAKKIFIGITLFLLVFAVTRFIGEDLQFIFKLIPPNFYVVFLSIIIMIVLFRINLLLLIMNSIDNWPKTYDSSELQNLYYKKNKLIPNIESVNYMPMTLKYLFIKRNKQIINSRKIEFENKFCECEYEDRMNKKLDINGTVFLFKDLDVVSFQSGQKLELMELSGFDELYEKKNLLKWLQFAASKTPAVIKTGGFNGKGDQFYYNRSALENSQLIAPSGYELANDIDYRMLQEYYYGNKTIIHNTEFFSFYQLYYSDTWGYGCGIKLDGSRILYKNPKIEYFKAKCKKIIESNDSK